MLRSLFRRFALGSQSLDRGRTERPRPQLEPMEDRITPSPLDPLPGTGGLATGPDKNLPSVSGASVCPEERSGEPGQPHSGASDSDPMAANSSRTEAASAISSTDLLFQGPQDRAGCAPDIDCKDQVFQYLQDCRYLIWIGDNSDPLPESNTRPDFFFALGEALQTIEWAVKVIANPPS